MRAPTLLPIWLALLASFPALAQDAPKVLFCSGPCFAVDPSGVRTPAPKGTELRLDQRFETGPGAYAQVKLGPDAAMALGDGARVRFDQKNFRDRLIVFLDLGRVRMIGGEAIGKPITRPVELHTSDGTFALRNADIEVKKSGTPNTASALTMVKLNAGDARLGGSPVSKQAVHGFTGGKAISRPIAISEIALTPPATRHAAPAPLPNIAIAPPLRGELALAPVVEPLPKTVTGALPGSIVQEPLSKPILSRGDIVPLMPIITPTGEVKTLTTYVLTDPVFTSSTTTLKSVELVDTTSLSTSTSLNSINLTTTSTSLTDTTVTKISTSPTTLTTTTITTSTLSTSPITSTVTSPLILDTSKLTFTR